MQLSIGHRLAGARRAQGLSILDVAHKTRISPTNIRHLESGEYASCPNLVYAKGFLKQLNRFLGAHLDQEIDNFDTGPVKTTPEVLLVVPDRPQHRSQTISAFSGETRPVFIGLMIGILLVVTLPVAAIKLHRKLNPVAADTSLESTTQPGRVASTHSPPVKGPTSIPSSDRPHVPDSAPPELAAIERFENSVELDELSPSALPAIQPVPEIYSTPAVATTSVPPRSTPTVTANRSSGALVKPTSGSESSQKKSFFSRLFGSKRRDE